MESILDFLVSMKYMNLGGLKQLLADRIDYAVAKMPCLLF